MLLYEMHGVVDVRRRALWSDKRAAAGSIDLCRAYWRELYRCGILHSPQLARTRVRPVAERSCARTEYR